MQFSLSSLVLTLALAAAATAGSAPAHACSKADPSGCRAYNDKLNAAIAAAGATRKQSQFGAMEVPLEMRRAFAVLASMEFPIFNSVLDLAKQSESTGMREVVFQEWIRALPGGMNWLPLSWGMQYTNFETVVPQSLVALEASLNKFLRGKPTADDILLATLFVGSVPHASDQNFIHKIRADAERLVNADGGSDGRGGPFYDTRVEIHQMPTRRTIERVRAFHDRYVEAGRTRQAQLAKSLIDDLESLFGTGSVDRVMARLGHAGADQLTRYKQVRAKLQGVRSADELERMLEAGEIVEALEGLVELASKAVEEGVAKRDASATCAAGGAYDCRFEWLELLAQVQELALALSTQAFGAAQEQQASFSIRDMLELAVPLVEINARMGLLSPQAVAPVRAMLKAKSLGAPQVNKLLQDLNRDILGAQKNIRAMFLSVSDKYRAFTGLSDKFDQDMVRATPLLPLAEFVGVFIRTLANKAGATHFYVDETRVTGEFQVINPGIARGKLIVADPREMLRADYVWDPKAIYVLTKTPAELQKVAGILTADSGSMISHVQLLAANHGLPNIFVGERLVQSLRALQGQEVLLVALSSGEAQITPWAKANAAEKKVYAEYYQIKGKQRFPLAVPVGVEKYNYPLWLEQLRMSDRGKIAGGKACGQGELSSVFGDAVPKALVLPFGVYYAHAKKARIYEDLKAVFADPATRDDPAKLAAALDVIRHRILQIEFDPKLEKYLTDALSRPPFANAGVFVRSDTNAEDLPQFVGAGLNETKANVVGVANVLEAIKQVWASPLAPKAISWRGDLIEQPWNVFPSVVIQKAINSEAAGVMVVGNVQSGGGADDEIMIAANRGLGITVVNGEYVPEELVYSRKSQQLKRIRNAHAGTMKVLKPEGGFSEVKIPPTGQVLTDEQAIELARIGAAAQKHMARGPKAALQKWDLEWGLVEGRFILFQIRPFIGNKIARDVGSLESLSKNPVGAKAARAAPALSLDQRAFVLPRLKKNSP